MQRQAAKKKAAKLAKRRVAYARMRATNPAAHSESLIRRAERRLAQLGRIHWAAAPNQNAGPPQLPPHVPGRPGSSTDPVGNLNQPIEDNGHDIIESDDDATDATADDDEWRRDLERFFD